MNLKKIKLLVLDVDGVLTDCKLYIGGEGEVMKAFYGLDGLGISIALRNGLEVAIITGRDSKIVPCRCGELGIKRYYLKIKDKTEKLNELMQELHLTKDEVAYMGDDLNDLAPMGSVGCKLAPFNAVAEIKAMADYVTAAEGGKGAVREVIEKILQAQNKWEKIVAEFKGQGQGCQQ